MRNMEPCRYEIYVAMKTALDDEKLDARILREMSENSNKSISNLVGLLLPRAIINPVVRLSGIDVYKRQVKTFTAQVPTIPSLRAS